MSAFVVDLDRFAANLAEIGRRIAPATHMLVVKDDAYGHGLSSIVTRARSEGVRWFGAFDVRTGRAVRTALGPAPRIFVWLVSGRGEADAAVAAGLDIGVGDELLLEDVAAAAMAVGERARVHLKIDSGLHRNGVRPERWEAFAARAASLESEGALDVVGIWSHIGEASDADDDDARRLFDTAVGQARAAGIAPRFLHLAASAAAFERSEFRYDLARIGAYAYGIRPAGGPAEADLGIVPVGALTARVTDAGETGVIIDVGAQDGLPSTLAGRMRVGTPGGSRRVIEIGPTVSRVERWPGAAVDDIVSVFGGVDTPSATDLAESIDTIGEEIVLRVSPLVPRVYR